MLAPSLRERFHKTREAFRREIVEIPIAMKAVRLRRLDRIYERFEDMGNYLGAAAILDEQAAKEMGGVYTGRGGAIESKSEQGPSEPRSPRADYLAELGKRFGKGLTLVQGGKVIETGEH